MGLVQKINHGIFNECVATSFAVHGFQMKIPEKLQLYTNYFHKIKSNLGKLLKAA